MDPLAYWLPFLSIAFSSFVLGLHVGRMLGPKR